MTEQEKTTGSVRCVAVVGSKQEFLIYCTENEILVRQNGLLGKKGNTTYVCCNVEVNVLGRRFDDAVFLRSSYSDKNTSRVADLVMQRLRRVDMTEQEKK